MSNEFATLVLGGQKTAVTVRETVEQPQEHNVPTTVVELADQLSADYERRSAWPKERFFDRSAPDILQAIRLFTQRINAKRNSENLPQYNPLELEDIVAKQSASLALPLQLFNRWTVLVRVGVRKLQKELMGLVAMMPMPSKGWLKLTSPIDNVGKTHYVIAHLFGERFLCRGYTTKFRDDGEWVLGGPKGNKWFKDLWLTPGLQSVDAIVAAKQRKANKEKDNRATQNLTNKITRARNASGLKAERFGAAHGARLDLENTAVMASSLACVRALIAQAVSYKENQTLDDIANMQGLTRAEATADPAQLGQHEETFKYHQQRLDNASIHVRSCRSFVFPRGYMVFDPKQVPQSIPQTARTFLTGINGVAVSAEYLESRDDVAALKTASLAEVEDLGLLIDACGESSINGRRVDSVELVFKDESGNDAENGAHYMRYYSAGRKPEDMPLDEFLKKASVRFVPMVINFNRRRLFTEDLQGRRNGISVEISFDDVNERFQPCRSNRS